MEDWVYRAMARWPNVPALFGWLSLDGRGRWRIQGETISRPQIIDTFNRNYAADDQGRWFFQNGPQRGYITLARAPLVLRAEDDGSLWTHTGEPVSDISAVYLDEHGGLWFATGQGPAALADQDLGWALERLKLRSKAVDEASLAEALALPSGTVTSLTLQLGGRRMNVQRMDAEEAPGTLGFVREPQPLPGERASR
jgi:hypothetical protein